MGNTMKRISSLCACLILAAALTQIASVSAVGQLKSQLDGQQNSSQSFLRPMSPSNFLGFFDMNRFSMHQSVGMSYLSSNAGGISLASYTNSMAYQISDPLAVRMDFTLQGSPFGSSGMYTGNDISKLFISRAELNYRLSENSFISVQYRQLPYNQWLSSDPFDSYRGFNSGYRSATMQVWGDQ